MKNRHSCNYAIEAPRGDSLAVPRFAVTAFAIIVTVLNVVVGIDIAGAYSGKGWMHIQCKELSPENDTPYSGASPFSIKEEYTRTLHFYGFKGETIGIVYDGDPEKNPDSWIWLQRLEYLDESILKEHGLTCHGYSARHPVWTRVPFFIFSLCVYYVLFLVWFGKRKTPPSQFSVPPAHPATNH